MKKGHKFKGKFPCPFCGVEAKSPQGLSGHIQMSHASEFEEWRAGAGLPAQDTEKGATGSPAPASAVPTSAELRQRKNEVELLSLEKRRRELARELGENQPRGYPDLSEVSGFGKMQPTIAEQLQSRAFQASAPSKPWYSDLLRGENLPILVSALRGVLGNQGGGGGDLSGIQTLLSLLGAKDLRGLIGASASPPVILENDLDLMGYHLPKGLPVSPELLGTLVQTAAAKSKDGIMADTLANAIAKISKLIGEERGGKISSDGGGHKQQYAICDQCGVEIFIPLDIQPGQKIKCPGCGSEFTAEDASQPQPRPQPRPKRAKVSTEPPLPDSVPCSGCGQLISVKGKKLGDELVCPICNTSQILTSPDIAVEPAEPEPTQETLYDKNLGGRRQ
jgi:DNA-directed RNA polymerase subunit RPC12/RpoP